MSLMPIPPVMDDDADASSRPTPILAVPIPEAARQPLVLWVENLSVSFDGFKALNELTLCIEPGEMRCMPSRLAGPPSSGRIGLMNFE